MDRNGAINTGSAGAPVLFNGQLGTPLGGVATNLTGTASGLTAGDVANAPVIAKVLTGYASGAGTVSAADSILSAFQKINGNDAPKAPIASPTFTGTATIPTLAATTINATGVVTVNNNSAAGPTPLVGDVLRLLQADGVQTRLTLESASANNTIGGRATGGTMAIPTATPNGTVLIQFGGYGLRTPYPFSSNGLFQIVADSLWSATNAATRQSFFTTPTGSITRAETFRLTTLGGVGIGPIAAVGTDPGSGSLNMDRKLTVGGNAGFNGTAPIAKPTITGSRGGNAALAPLLTALANYGLLTDSTTV